MLSGLQYAQCPYNGEILSSIQQYSHAFFPAREQFFKKALQFFTP